MKTMVNGYGYPGGVGWLVALGFQCAVTGTMDCL